MGKSKMQLSTKVFIGFGLGIILGLIFKEQILVIKPLGDLFLRLIKMIVVPLVFFSIISGVASMGDIKKLQRVGSKTLLYYFVTTAISGLIGLTVARALKPGAGFALDMIQNGTVEAKEAPKFMDTLLNMVPVNPFQSLVDGNLIQIIIFAVFVGIAITIIGEKGKPVKDIADSLAEIMYKITGIVMAYSPIGVTALIAASVGEYGLKIFGPLSKLILADYVGMGLVLVLLYTVMLKVIAKIGLKEFYKHIFKIWAVTASTTSSSGTLPVSIRTVEEDFNVKPELAGFTLPLGATMNMNGAAIYFAVAVVFVSQIYGIEMSFAQQGMIVLLSTMISVGAPGIPGGGIVMTIMLLNTMGLPVEIMGLIAGIYRILDMGHTTINVTGDVVSTLCIARTENEYKVI
ncbi:dicarboxylate/amino acid:cation symporter [Fusibacter ferrireducens]|uniref:Dicarboxylate/amino acid:cation symporter n=1 Tax=Fusibacter ferrireducens TaxID=2785058 RepID=A0ABR9ZVF8_9FIRM|nr:dicarboxylate/amino acid:cation symporter [Fusibacter ferrireducens]MBF4694439.1 dicarboxylate/amino acid:cation symporter [Fusibacter ferrireducens]